MPKISPATPKAFITILFVVLSLVLSSGCAGNKATTTELLAQDFRQLSDDDLTLYYYRIEDQIEVVERQRTGSSISLGIGRGSYSHRGGSRGGIGVTTGGSTQRVATDLRERRNQVKLEMKRRGITP